MLWNANSESIYMPHLYSTQHRCTWIFYYNLLPSRIVLCRSLCFSSLFSSLAIFFFIMILIVWFFMSLSKLNIFLLSTFCCCCVVENIVENCFHWCNPWRIEFWKGDIHARDVVNSKNGKESIEVKAFFELISIMFYLFFHQTKN